MEKETTICISPQDFFQGNGPDSLAGLRTRAEDGDPDSCYLLAEALMDMVTERRNPQEPMGASQSWMAVLAAQYFRIAGNQGHGISMRRLAVCYDRGIGVQADGEKARRWSNRALLALDPSALFERFIELHNTEELCKQVEARYWLSLAVEKGVDGAAELYADLIKGNREVG